MKRIPNWREHRRIRDAREKSAAYDRVRARGDALRDGNRHRGYIVGQHWLSVAYERICAGEPEPEVMADYGWQPRC